MALSTDLARLTPDTRARAEALIAAARAAGYAVTVRSTRRSCAEQFEQWLQGFGAPTSWHTFGRAVDLTLEPGECSDYTKMGELWEKWGGVWGGRWRGEKFGACGDMGHFQWTPGLSTVAPECEDTVVQGAFGLAGFVLGAGSFLASWWLLNRRVA